MNLISEGKNDQDSVICGDQWLNAINKIGEDETTSTSALMEVNEQKIKFQIDSGVDANTICKKYVRKEQVQPTSVNLCMWNKSTMQPLGEATLPMANPRTGEI